MMLDGPGTDSDPAVNFKFVVSVRYASIDYRRSHSPGVQGSCKGLPHLKFRPLLIDSPAFRR